MAPAADFSEQYYLRLLERRPASVFFVPAGALLARFVEQPSVSSIGEMNIAACLSS
jgi:hypothetical protein